MERREATFVVLTRLLDETSEKKISGAESDAGEMRWCRWFTGGVFQERRMEEMLQGEDRGWGITGDFVGFDRW